MGNTLKGVGDSLHKQLQALTQASDQKLSAMRETVERRLSDLQEGNTQKLDEIRREATDSAQKTRDEVGKTIGDFLSWQRVPFADVIKQLTGLTESNEKRLETVRATVEEKLKSIQDDNTKQFEQIRATVDEKLQGTLEKRLGESFKLVSERLEQVHQGLGEMQALATGVGDLKGCSRMSKPGAPGAKCSSAPCWRKFSTRGTNTTRMSPQGEQPDGWSNATRAKLPGAASKGGDCPGCRSTRNFPWKTTQRLMEAQRTDAEPAGGSRLQTAGDPNQEGCAGTFAKYVDPAEDNGLRRALLCPPKGCSPRSSGGRALIETIQREYRVVIAGPTTLGRILNSLQMGFRTLAIQQALQ